MTIDRGRHGEKTRTTEYCCAVSRDRSVTAAGDYYYYYFFFNPRKTRVGKKLKKLKRMERLMFRAVVQLKTIVQQNRIETK